jgi:hypothetical protein
MNSEQKTLKCSESPPSQLHPMPQLTLRLVPPPNLHFSASHLVSSSLPYLSSTTFLHWRLLSSCCHFYNRRSVRALRKAYQNILFNQCFILSLKSGCLILMEHTTYLHPTRELNLIKDSWYALEKRRLVPYLNLVHLSLLATKIGQSLQL